MQISNTENLSLVYNSSILGDIPLIQKSEYSTEYIQGKFLDCLSDKKQEEIVRSQSVIGPHRDDISYFINSVDAKKYASQGQQRTIVLSLKLAELELIMDKSGTNAILLLDDVLAELDDIRQNFLLDAIGNETQTIITSVDTLHFQSAYLRNVELFEIKNNSVKNIRIN